MNYFCAACGVKNCARVTNDPDKFPENCPTRLGETDEYRDWYKLDPTDWLMAHTSALVSPDHSEPRLVKTIHFAKECGFQKIGLAFCMTLRQQAQVVNRILLESGLDVYSVVCKVGCEDRSVVDAPSGCKAMCNPIAQAMLLNKAGTQLNIMMGLCVGHDSLFIRHSQAPVTVLAAKDHVYNNAPLEYLADYLRAKSPGKDIQIPMNAEM